MNRRIFPDDFIWGVATSAYQIEGAVAAGGRGASIWDTFCRVPGAVVEGESGERACDHYHRWRDDVALMAELGVLAYRFSIAWPRIQPTGTEAVPNAAGLDFYDQLVDGLSAVGITPWVTLYHWDLPQHLEDRGGWRSRDTAEAFAVYAGHVADRLGDRVKHWITINEPWCVAVLGHELGEHAPGLEDPAAMLQAAHHTLLAHGLAVPRIRERVPDARIGITLNLCPAWPASDSAVDREATRKFDGWFNRWYLDPVNGRGYPEDRIADLRTDGLWPEEGAPSWLEEGDTERIAVSCDFLGLNYYSRAVVRDGEAEENDPPHTFASDETTDMDWEVSPDALRNLLLHLAHVCPLPIVITENGGAWPDGPGEDGRIRDEARRDYLERHLSACHRAMGQGARVLGYFAWSLMDNFEWAHGYAKRFGLVWVDYESQARIPKDSARWYQAVIRDNGLMGGEG